jgi:hypothetical protein
MGNKPIKIQFYNSFPKMDGVFPTPEPISKDLPSWFKKQSSYKDNDPTPENGRRHSTVKRCPAIFDLMVSGYVLKCPVDVYIDATGDKLSVQFPNGIGQRVTGNHDLLQYDEMPIDDSYTRELLRLNLIWLVSTPKGYSSLFLSPQFSDITFIQAIPGIIDTDEYMSDGLFSFLIKKGFKGEIKRGTPLIQVIPFKRDEYEMEVIQDRNFPSIIAKQRLKNTSFFSGGYKKMFWSKKVYK